MGVINRYEGGVVVDTIGLTTEQDAAVFSVPNKRNRFVDQGTKTAAFTLTSWMSVSADTTAGAFAFTLPASPVAGDETEILLSAGTNALTIKDSGGTTVDTLTVAGFGVTLRWTGSAWKVGVDRRSKAGLDATYQKVITVNTPADYTGRAGTVGTGTDARSAIQAALNAASSINDSSYYGYLSRNSYTVRMAPGSYVVSAPTSDSSLVIPAGVAFDSTDATLYFDYPDTARRTWSGIKVTQYGQLHIGRIQQSGRVAVPTDTGGTVGDHVYDAIRLVNTDNNTRVIGYKDSEIRGFRGAGIRGIGCWISFVKGIRFYANSYGYVAANVGSGTLGVTIPTGNPSGAYRWHTDLFMEDCHFINHTQGSVRGVVKDDTASAFTEDFSSLGFTPNFLNCVFEASAAPALNIVSASILTTTNCGFEEVGSTQGMVVINNVRVANFKNTRVNFAGATVPGPNGNAIPFPGAFVYNTSTNQIVVDSMYCHNDYNNAFRPVQNTPGQSLVLKNLTTDSRAFSSTSPGFPGIGGTSWSGNWQYGHLMLGARHLWTDANGMLRVKSTAPLSDLDGNLLDVGLVQTKTAAYTILGDDSYVNALGTFTLTLPAVAAGQRVVIKNVGTGTITVAPASGTIDGAGNTTLTTQYQSKTFYSDGTNWFIE